ncbi:MAG: aminotransferase class I/II-fold pyridoxal phosphate-dependent enzyme [Chloroflexi bacterium]|nr:MAG: aminotransferase class I/II-fold pyridoxal phosphate-dependent enzyme [Chloroflexota bacterium]
MSTKNPVKPPIKMSATLALNAKISELRAGGHQVYHMGFGEAKFPVHPKVMTAFQEHAAARSYLPVTGLPQLRQKVAEYYRRRFGIPAQAEGVVIGSGSKTMLFAAMYALQGDVLLPSPTWVSYETQAQLSGKSVTWIPTTLENNYCPTANGLKAALSAARAAGQSPQILVLTSPGNPTGSVYPPELIKELTDVARQEELVIISDEIYALTTYGEEPFVSVAQYYPERTIVTGGLSKHLSLGGWRLGVAIMPPGEIGRELNNYMAAVAGAVWTTASAPVQYAAVVAYSDDPDIDAYAEKCTQIHGAVTTHLHDSLTALNIPCSKPGGGFYVYASFAPWREALAQKHNIHTSEELAHFLLDETHVAALPGSVFGAAPQDLSLRLSTSYLYAFTDDEGWEMLNNFDPARPRDEYVAQYCPGLTEACRHISAFIESLDK